MPAASVPALMSSARLVMGRSRLERYRNSTEVRDLESARNDLRAVNPARLTPRERIELQVGFGELLFVEHRFGASAEMLDPIVGASATLAPDAHERALDWWATALDRQAQALPGTERAPVYRRITERMEEELRRESSSTPAAYWLAASARASGDLDRAWAAASAGWVRAVLAADHGAALRADLDRLVTEGIIPDRAARAPARERYDIAASLAAEWDAFKKMW